MKQKIMGSIKEIDFSGLRVPLIAVYQHPEDFPAKYVARIYELNKPTDTLMVKSTLEEIEMDIRKNTGMVFAPREAEDVRSLVGVWI